MKLIAKSMLAGLFVFIALGLSAQNIYLGVKGGANFVNVTGPAILDDIDALPNFQQIPSFNIGLVSELELTDNIGIQGEVVYTKKGFEIDENYDLTLFDFPVPIGATAISRFNYIEAPLMLKAKFGNEVVKGYVLGGPTFGYATSGQLTTRAKVIVEFDLFTTDIPLETINYERFEVGATAGGGVAFQVGSGQLFADARYHYGFTEIYDIPLLSERVQNRGVSLNVGYMHGF